MNDHCQSLNALFRKVLNVMALWSLLGIKPMIERQDSPVAAGEFWFGGIGGFGGSGFTRPITGAGDRSAQIDLII